MLPGKMDGIHPYQQNNEKKFRGHQWGQPYLAVSGGAGLWSRSWQPGMTVHSVPLAINAEYGRTSLPVSLVAGLVRSTFTIDRFLMNPNNFIAGIQYAPLRGKKIAEKFNIYLAGGLNVSLNRFTEEIYPGIINYEYKIEKKTSAGITAVAGAGYRIRAFEIRPALYYFTGKAGFLAGHFTEQTFHTGSLQLHLMISYRMIFNGDKITCPAYKRYKKL
jgi:hypothetical protein